MRPLLGMVVVLSVAAALAGCGDEDGTGGAAPFELPVGTPSYDVDAPTWAVRKEIRVGDETITVKPAPDVYVVTTSGIYYVSHGTLHFTDGGPAEKVAHLGHNSLALSSDGQRLAVIDGGHGPEDPYGAHAAVPVVFDLGTGKQVFRGAPGSSVEDDDLAVLYGELPPGLIGIDDEAVYAVDPLQENENDRTRFPLDGGAPEPFDGNPMLPDESGIHGYATDLPGGRFEWRPTFTHESQGPMSTAILSPAGDVFFTMAERGGRYYDMETGRPTVFSETPFTLGGWVDDDTFYGAFSARGTAEGPGGATAVATCDVGPRPTCTVVAELDLPQWPVLLFGTGRDRHT